MGSSKPLVDVGYFEEVTSEMTMNVIMMNANER